MKNSAKNPADFTTTSGGPASSSHKSVDNFSSKFISKLWAITSVNPFTQSGFFANTSSTHSLTASPRTPSLSSPSSLTASSALFFPILSGPSRKKLLPASWGVTFDGSRIVKWPIPGRTRFLRIEVDVALAERTKIRDASRAFWPVAAQRLTRPKISCCQILLKADNRGPKLSIISTSLCIWLASSGGWSETV